MQTGAGPSCPKRHGIPTSPDGGSGYDLPDLIGRPGLQPAPRGPADGRTRARPLPALLTGTTPILLRGALLTPRLRRCARATVERCPVLVRLSHGRPRRQTMRCNAIPWPAQPTCARKRQVANRSVGAASHGRPCGPTATGKRQRLNRRRASLFSRLAPAATARPAGGTMKSSKMNQAQPSTTTPEATLRPASGWKTATGVSDTWNRANLWERQTFTTELRWGVGIAKVIRCGQTGMATSLGMRLGIPLCLQTLSVYSPGSVTSARDHSSTRLGLLGSMLSVNVSATNNCDTVPSILCGD